MKFLDKIFNETNNKKKIENLIFLIILLIITLAIMNYIWKDEKQKTNEEIENNSYEKVLASENKAVTKDEFIEKLENTLSTIKGVGNVNVLLNYTESSSVIPIYDETTTTSSTEEQDTSGGTRNVTQTQSQKEVVFSESSGTKQPITQKTIMPIVQGAIITAEGAGNITIKTNIISAIQALTGLSADKIQVFEME